MSIRDPTGTPQIELFHPPPPIPCWRKLPPEITLLPILTAT